MTIIIQQQGNVPVLSEPNYSMGGTANSYHRFTVTVLSQSNTTPNKITFAA